jgi:Tfp pilus assembly protein PilP
MRRDDFRAARSDHDEARRQSEGRQAGHSTTCRPEPGGEARIHAGRYSGCRGRAGISVCPSTRRVSVVFACVVAVSLALCVQSASTQGQPLPPVEKENGPRSPSAALDQKTPPANQLPPPADTYSYDPQGRRDPFISLIGKGTEPAPIPGRRVAELQAMLIDEVTVSGIMKSRGEFVAILKSPDGKTFLGHPNDRLLDGTIKAITADTVVFRQEITNPLSATKEREIRKALRAPEEVP